MKRAGAHILGLGAQTAVGRTALACAAAVRAGVPRLGEHPDALDDEGDPLVVGMASYLPEYIPIEERVVELVYAAASEALLPIAGVEQALEIVVGLPAPRTGLPTSLETTIVAELDRERPGGPSVSGVQTIVAGHSAGLMAIERARTLLCDGAVDLCLAGGVDSYIDAETLLWLSESRQAHTRSNPWGFIPGEGSGFCLLGSYRFVEQHPKLRRLGQITAAATALEKNLIRTDSVCTGEGLTTAWKAVLAEAPSISQVICDHNGEPYRADELSFSLLRLGDRLEHPESVLAPAQYWGDVGVASGPLFICLAAVAGLRGYATGRHYLVSTSSESGERTAAVVDLASAIDREPEKEPSPWR